MCHQSVEARRNGLVPEQDRRTELPDRTSRALKAEPDWWHGAGFAAHASGSDPRYTHRMGIGPPSPTIRDDRGIEWPCAASPKEEPPPAAPKVSRVWVSVVGVAFGGLVIAGLLWDNGTVHWRDPGLLMLVFAAGACRRLAVRIPLLLLAVAMLLWLIGWPGGSGLDGSGFVVLGAWLVVSLVPDRVLSMALSRSAARRVTMLRRGLCPACAAQLPRTLVAANQLTVCDQCGAAWRVGPRTKLVDPATCPGCSYSLHGLKMDDDCTVRCPECGWVVLLPATKVRIGGPSRSRPRCWGCGDSLVGLPLQYGDRVRCPNCGQWRSGLTAGDVATPSEPRA